MQATTDRRCHGCGEPVPEHTGMEGPLGTSYVWHGECWPGYVEADQLSPTRNRYLRLGEAVE